MGDQPNPVRTIVMNKVVEIMGRISRANAAAGYFYDVTPDRVRRGRRILPNDPPPCISVFVGLEEPDTGEPQSGGRMWSHLPVSIAYKAALDGQATQGDIEAAAELFIADIELAMGLESAPHNAAMFEVPIPKYPSGVLDNVTVWWREVAVAAYVGAALPNSVFGTVDYLLRYNRSIFTPYQA